VTVGFRVLYFGHIGALLTLQVYRSAVTVGFSVFHVCVHSMNFIEVNCIECIMVSSPMRS
jgi:hypothetical protein